MKSKLVLLEGPSGTGKGSRIKDFIKFLRLNIPYKVHQFREPQYFRDEIKTLRRTPNFDKKESLELFIKSRKRLLEDYKPLLEQEDNICVLERSLLSTYVVQQMEGFNLEKLIGMHDFYPEPDLAMALLSNPEIAMQRIIDRNKKTGEPISPNENLPSLTKQMELYQELTKRFSYLKTINTDGRPEAINLVIQSHIKKLLGIKMNKAIFLDKDGTLVTDKGYPEIIPSDNIYSFSYKGLRSAQEEGYKLFLVSSQPWVARGRMTSEEVKKVFESVVKQYRDSGIIIDDYSYCEHHRTKILCPDKKPGTRLIESMAKKYNIDLTESYIVGDLENDTIAGKRIGLTTVRVKTGNFKDKAHEIKPDYTIKDIGELGQIISKKAFCL